MKHFTDFKLYEICDIVLNFLYSETALSLPDSKLGERLKNNSLISYGEVRIKFKDKAQIDLSKEQLDVVLMILEEDGFIIKVSENEKIGGAIHDTILEGKIVQKIYGDKYFFSITVNGVMKILEGGYSQKFIDTKNQKIIAFAMVILTGLLTLGTIVAAWFYGIEIYKYYFVSSACTH